MLHEIVNDLNKSIQELFPMKKASCIYHYTSINVLWEFLRDESDFYCTYFKALSDPTEFQTGIFAIARILREISRESCNDFIDMFSCLYSMSGKSGRNLSPWIMSFSTARDETILWKSFTNQSLGGCSIGFSKERLSSMIYKNLKDTTNEGLLIFLLPCLYVGSDDQSKIEGLIKYVLVELSMKLTKALNKYKKENDNKELSRAILTFVLSAIIKHKDFKYEQEWRLIVLPIELESIRKKCEMIGGKIRIKSGLCCNDVKMSSFIDEIIVSPQGPSDHLNDMIKLYVDLQGINRDDKQLVISSESPYRGND